MRRSAMRDINAGKMYVTLMHVDVWHGMHADVRLVTSVYRYSVDLRCVTLMHESCVTLMHVDG